MYTQIQNFHMKGLEIMGTQLISMGTILAIVVVVAVLVLLAMDYVKASPNKAYIISGLRKEPKVMIGKAGIKIPFLEKMDEFSELSKEKAELITNRIYDLDGKFDTQISDDTFNQHHTQIGYKIGGSFEDYSDNGNIGFEILFPHIYASYEEAQYNNYRLSAQMEKQSNGEVIIVLYEDKVPVETIRWDEWQKYKCNHIKEESKNSSFTDALTDYEPYSAKFEDIFRDYCGNKDRKMWPMQYLAYWVEPVILMENDGSYTAKKE